MRRIAQLRDRFPELQSHGLDVVIVYCQRRASVTRWLKKHPMPFPILPDEDRTFAKRWGVFVAINYDSINIARPASFVVDRTGIIRHARIWRHQLAHAPIEELLAVGTPPN